MRRKDNKLRRNVDTLFYKILSVYCKILPVYGGRISVFLLLLSLSLPLSLFLTFFIINFVRVSTVTQFECLIGKVTPYEGVNFLISRNPLHFGVHRNKDTYCTSGFCVRSPKLEILVRVCSVRNQGQSVSSELELRFEDCSKFDATVRYN